VEAARRLVEALLARARPDVRAVGVTGSGREAVATVLRAAYPALAARIVVENEIVAHATAAIRCDERGGESLSVVEIGGQDAKFIQIAGGQIVESGMNKACSAGTGSFLEEQAALYGVRDIEDFDRLAAAAERPPDLGQMCTVFVAEAAGEARGEGFDVPDLFAGFQYSVIHNYLHRVMEQRTFARTVFFQGKPASSDSLAWTLAAVIDRDVVVPPNPGAMGAWGIGLCARAQLGDALPGPGFDLGELLGARVVETAEFQCKDRGCATLCSIDRAVVQVGREKRTVLSGGACPKYEISTAARPKLPADAPSAFDEREALIAALATPDRDGDGDGPLVAVPAAGALAGRLPWLLTFVRALGGRPRLLRGDARTLAAGEAECQSYDACAPVKLAHGLGFAADGSADAVFFPKLLGLDDRDGPPGLTCPSEQAMPDLVAAALGARGRASRVVAPTLGSHDDHAALVAAARALGLPAARVPAALAAAAAAQREHEAALAKIGERTLAWARAHGARVVVLCGMAHVIHERALDAGVPRILRESGVLALPASAMPIPAGTHPMPTVAWTDTRRALRAALAARARGDVYPVWLSAFGCGPASFAEQLFTALLEGHPHAVLESDGHGGSAGYVTRIQAFLHAVRAHDGRPSAPSPRRLRALDPAPPAAPLAELRRRRLVVLAIGDLPGPLLAAAYRAAGVDAVAAPSASPEVLAAGRRDCSGKECLPYQLLWGSFRRHLEGAPPERDTELVQVDGQGMCRNCLFPAKDALGLQRLGLDRRVRVRTLRMDRGLGWSFLARAFAGIVAWDLLRQLAAYTRPAERAPGLVDRVYAHHAGELRRLAERRVAPGVRGLPGHARAGRDLVELLARAAVAFADAAPVGDGGATRRTVLLSGNIYVRLDDFASDDLVRRLNARGLRVLVEPMSVLSEYFAGEAMAELMGLPTDPREARQAARAMALVRRALARVVRRHHPWLPDFDPAPMQREAARVFDRRPAGEAPVTVGSALHAWRGRLCDGVVLASPWGCGPAQVAESLLRHQRDIPLLTVYTDGTPIDERRLGAFAFRVRRLTARTGCS
jgi:predicted nucleotide-binding protein (sugar kinase/HSP70/actin superfamily)